MAVVKEPLALAGPWVVTTDNHMQHGIETGVLENMNPKPYTWIKGLGMKARSKLRLITQFPPHWGELGGLTIGFCAVPKIEVPFQYP